MSEWYFRDNQGKIQGPFSSEEMHAWLEAGYLSPDLMVSKGNNTNFKQLQQYGANAFTGGGDDGEDDNAQWYFIDRNYKQQGPFSSLHMRQWMMNGYFEPTLLIINTAIPNPKWAQLKEFFPNIADAFVSTGVVPGNANKGKGAQGGASGTDPRFNFPEWLPIPPRYRGVKKVYPSEKNGGKRMVTIRDVNGQNVQTLNVGR